MKKDSITVLNTFYTQTDPHILKMRLSSIIFHIMNQLRKPIPSKKKKKRKENVNQTGQSVSNIFPITSGGKHRLCWILFRTTNLHIASHK